MVGLKDTIHLWTSGTYLGSRKDLIVLYQNDNFDIALLTF